MACPFGSNLFPQFVNLFVIVERNALVGFLFTFNGGLNNIKKLFGLFLLR